MGGLPEPPGPTLFDAARSPRRHPSRVFPDGVRHVFRGAMHAASSISAVKPNLTLHEMFWLFA
jgi:hypothetical protein